MTKQISLDNHVASVDHPAPKQAGFAFSEWLRAPRLLEWSLCDQKKYILSVLGRTPKSPMLLV